MSGRARQCFGSCAIQIADTEEILGVRVKVIRLVAIHAARNFTEQRYLQGSNNFVRNFVLNCEDVIEVAVEIT